MNFKQILCRTVILFLSHYFSFISADCQIPAFSNDNSPIYIYNNTRNYNFVIPEGEFINLRRDENIVLACPGPGNAITQPINSNSTIAKCVAGNKLQIGRKNVLSDDLSCRKHIHGQIKILNKICGNGEGRVINIGYSITRKDWITLMQVCYNNLTGITLYTEHTIIGSNIKDASKTNYRPSFSTYGVGNGIPTAVAYKRPFQKSTFNQLLKSSVVADLYINDKSYLARGHLSPDADFLFAAWQFTTYFYINVCPQWQAINGGNWKTLEGIVRKTAEKYATDLKIFTGTYEVLSLPDKDSRMKNIYLASGNKLPVPKYLWKIVYNENDKSGIVIVALNNPFVEEVTAEDYLCEDICQDYGWYVNSWSDSNKGFIYCCDVREFMTIVETAPKIIVKNVLERIK